MISTKYDLEEDKLDTRCPGYFVSGIESEQEILVFYDELRIEHPESRPFFILDDVWQALYTSGHAISRYGLESPGNFPLSEEQRRQLKEDYRLPGDLGFRLRLHNLLAGAAEISVEKMEAAQISVTKELWEDTARIQFDITTAFQIEAEQFHPGAEKKTWCFLAPVRRSPEALAAFPNGYFDGCLCPFENYTIAKHLLENFGYDYLGIGAGFIGFVHREPASLQVACDVVDSLIHLFKDFDKIGLSGRMVDAMAGKRHFVMRYY